MATIGPDTSLPNATGPCKITQEMAAEKYAKEFEILVLNDFLAEDESMAKTIDNLQKLLERMSIINNLMSKTALFNARRALVSLETLTNIMTRKA